MKKVRLTDIQQAELSGADFSTYKDEVVQSIHDWEVGADAWNSRLHFIYRHAYSPATIQDGQRMLAQAQDRYVQHCIFALSIVARQAPIPEIAVRSIENLLKADDKKRTERLRDYRPQQDVPSMPSVDIRGIAKAFGDPEGIIETDELLEAVTDPTVARNMAIEAYTFHLNALSEHIVGHLIDHYSGDIEPTPTSTKPTIMRRLGGATLHILNRFKRK